MKIKTITLTAGWGHKDERDATGYRVEQVTDSLAFTPGDIISRAQAKDLCDVTDWKVTIKQHRSN